MQKPLQNKIALVTGAARGIGQAIALRLASDGATLALLDLKTDWLQQTAEQARQLGATVRPYPCDVASATSVDHAVRQVCADFSQIHILVNNAGITRDALLLRMSEADWDAVLAVNLKGAFLMTRAVARVMLRQRSGAIVNLASVVGLLGNAGQANYTASKAGLIALTKTTARELGPRNIRANAVAPGFIQTAMTDALPEHVRTAMTATIPLARPGQPSDVANTVAFLVGPDAAYITGQVLAVCGGMTMA